MTKLYAKISKVNEDERIVEGYASTEALDSQGEKVTRKAVEDALADYMKFANIREMHQPSAVGKTLVAELDEKGLKIVVEVVDDSAWQKVKKKVYNGFSIGGTATKKINNSIEEMILTEISLVDRPANPEALITVFKAEQSTQGIVMKKSKEEVGKALQQVAQANLKKSCGLWNAADLANLLDNLNWITSSTEWEKQYEGDDSKVPEMLRQGYALLGEALKALVAESVDEQKANQNKDKAVAEILNAEVAVVAEGVTKVDDVEKSDDAKEEEAAADQDKKEKEEEDKGEATAKSEEDGDVTKSEDDVAKEEEEVVQTATPKLQLTENDLAALDSVYQLMKDSGYLDKIKSNDAAAEANPTPSAGEVPADKAEEEKKGEGVSDDQAKEEAKDEADNKDKEAVPGKEEEEDKKENKEVTEKMAKAFDAYNNDAQILKAAGLSSVQEALDTIAKQAGIIEHLKSMPAITKGNLMIVGRDGKVEQEITASELINKGANPLAVLDHILNGNIPSAVIKTHGP